LQASNWPNTSLLEMAHNRLWNTMLLLLTMTNLNGIVAVGVLGFDLHNWAWSHFNDSYNDYVAVLIVDLGHADLLA
jgi:hypothetical protein